MTVQDIAFFCFVFVPALPALICEAVYPLTK